jgi:RNA polymerase sigma-54 factor
MLRQLHTQKQHLNVLPQQIQLLKLFHLNTLELQQRIQAELNENPVLEEDVNEDDKIVDNTTKDTVQDYQDEDEYSHDDIPDYKTEYNNYLAEDSIPQRPISELYDFRKDLKEQIRLCLKDDRDIMIAEYLIDCLNDEGILEQDMISLADDISFNRHMLVEPMEMERVRGILKQLEPFGIGCTTIKEFLLLQLHRMDQTKPHVKKAIRLLEEHFDDLAHRNVEKAAANLQVEENELRSILQLIGSCKMKPLTESFTPASNATIIPDFIIINDGDNFEISLYRQRSSTLFINQSFLKILSTQKQTDKGTVQYLKSKINSAQWFVNAIKQRETTMLTVMKVIVDLQFAYFKEGDIRLLKPMILKNVADRAGVDISTVSRITCNKYADTPFGTILLKDLFSEGIENEQGEVISNRVIQTAIEEVVENEDKKNPYTDQQLVAILSLKGFNIARRTVAKYREQLQIPVAQMRALWAS